MTTANQASYDTWNGDSGRRWVTDPDRRDHVMQNVAAVLLEAADLTVGDSVLDVGCGCGATALAAARGVGADGAVKGILARSGFTDIDVQAATVPLRLGADPDEATAHLADTGVGRAVLATIPDADHTAAVDAVRAVLAAHRGADGVQLDGATLLTSATRF